MDDEINLEKLATKLDELDNLEVKDVLLRFEVGNYKIHVFKDYS